MRVDGFPLKDMADCSPMVMRVSMLLYGLMTLLIMCVNGPLTRSFPHIGGFWLLGLFLSLLLLLAVVKARQSGSCTLTSAYEKLLFYYALLLSVVSVIHYAALDSTPGGTVINAAGMMAIQAMKQERAYALYYLLFPVMLLVQLAMQRMISLKIVIRWLILAAFLSLGVALYQLKIDFSFLHTLSWGIRYEGLATDPNALALICFLLLPILIMGIVIEQRGLLRFAYLLLLSMLFMVGWHTGSRTALAGILLFLLLFPVVLAACMRHWRPSCRAALAMVPLLAVVIGLQLAPSLMPVVGTSGYTGRKLAQTWQKFEAGGMRGVFFKGEARGRYLIVGKNLIAKSPIGGWGPGGFYFEASNIHYRAAGNKGDFIDSAVNHYIMIAGDFGIPILLLNLLMIVLPMLLAMAALRRMRGVKRRFLVAIPVAANMVFLLMVVTVPPSYFLGVCWLWAAVLARLLLTAERHGIIVPLPAGWLVRGGLVALAILLLVTIAAGSYSTSFGAYGYDNHAAHPWWTGRL